jgi:hypothetical protein
MFLILGHISRQFVCYLREIAELFTVSFGLLLIMLISVQHEGSNLHDGQDDQKEGPPSLF